jgi:hypothetical protein
MPRALPRFEDMKQLTGYFDDGSDRAKPTLKLRLAPLNVLDFSA